MLRWLSGEIFVSDTSHSVEEAGIGDTMNRTKGFFAFMDQGGCGSEVVLQVPLSLANSVKVLTGI